jgi:hypothetical protein
MAGVAVRFDPGSVAVVGLIAGSICAAFETRAAAVLTGTEFAAMPLRMIAAIVPGAVGAGAHTLVRHQHPAGGPDDGIG